MNIPRIFATALARRVAYVVVALVLASLGVGTARAGDHVVSMEAAEHCESFVPLVVVGQTDPGNGYVENPRCEHTTGPFGWPWIGAFILACREMNFNGTVRSEDGSCGNGAVLERQHRYQQNSCTGAPPLTGVTGGPSDDRVCRSGCEYQCDGASIVATIDGKKMTVCSVPTWSATGSTCSSGAGGLPPATPQPNDRDGDGTSDDNDSAPNNPGQGGGGDESGDGEEDGGGLCGGPGQSPCGDPGTGSGNGNTSGGGGDCNTPPRSTGDAILAQIAYQTWATRCAITGKGNAGPGTGSDPGNGGEQGQPDWTKGDGPPVPTDDTDYPSQQTRFGLGVSPDLLDEENIFGNASCPNFSITIWSQTVSTADFDGWCNLVVILRGLILIFGAFSALQILMGRGLV